MGLEKDIRFTEKKVDESWKDQISKEAGRNAPASPEADQPKAKPVAAKKNPTNTAFVNLISSLGYQAMLSLGEMPSPDGIQTPPNLEAAREIIEILVSVKDKTNGNLSTDEEKHLSALLAELQMKFAQKL